MKPSRWRLRAQERADEPDSAARQGKVARALRRWWRMGRAQAPNEPPPDLQGEAARRADEARTTARARIESDISAASAASRASAAPRRDRWQRDDNVFNELSRAINARARGALHDIRFSMSTRISWNYTRILWETLVISLVVMALVYACAAMPQLEALSTEAARQVSEAACALEGGLAALPEPTPSPRPAIAISACPSAQHTSAAISAQEEATPELTRAPVRLIDLRLSGADRSYVRVSGLDGRVYYDDAPFELASASLVSYWEGEFYRVDALLVNAGGRVYQIYVAAGLGYWLRLCMALLGCVALFDLLRGLYFLTRGRAVNAQMLEPISKISETARALNAQNLSKRINVEGTRSELRELALVINDMLERIQAAYDGQKQFVSDASHELRTPIAVIQGYASMLKRWGKDDAQVRDEAISAIDSEAANMKELVDKLLFLARHDRQTLKLDAEPVDMCELANAIARETRMIDPNHEIVCGDMQQVRVLGDGAALKQALRIFMDNACKYTPAGGRITISCRQGGMGALLSVEDTGCGIPAGELKRIFDRFYRVDGSRGAVPGHGLGLSIARIIAVRHGGRIHVRSREGAGSTFTLELPGMK